MKQTPIDYEIVASTISEMGLDDFSTATIRDIATLSRVLEKKTGKPFIHLEMGVPGLKPSKIGMDAEAKALADIGESTDVELVQLSAGKSFLVPVPSSKMLMDFMKEAERTQFFAIEPDLINFEP